jgi:hypothetical protein
MGAGVPSISSGGISVVRTMPPSAAVVLEADVLSLDPPHPERIKAARVLVRIRSLFIIR